MPDIVRIINAAFEVEREFRRSPSTLQSRSAGSGALLESSTSSAFSRPIRVVHMERPL